MHSDDNIPALVGLNTDDQAWIDELTGSPPGNSEPEGDPSLPDDLGERGQRLWNAFTESNPNFGQGEIELLVEACRLVDRLTTLEAELESLPLTVKGSRGQPVPQPLLSEIRAERGLLAKLIEALNPKKSRSEAGRQNALQRRRTGRRNPA